MGFFRFYRRTSIAPGVRLNLSKRGVSTSFGRRGAHFTVGTHGTRETIGLPGSGVSYTMISGKRRRGNKPGSAIGGLIILLVIGVVVWKLL